MKLSELHRVVNLFYSPDKPHRDSEVMVATTLPYTTVGAIPMTAVKSAIQGFDWESGKFIIHPVESLSPSEDKLKEQFVKYDKKIGQLYDENRNLKAEIKKLEKQLKDKL